jgi:hypothetical protein
MPYLMALAAHFSSSREKFEGTGLPPRATVIDDARGGGVGSLPPRKTYVELGDGPGHRGRESERWRR